MSAYSLRRRLLSWAALWSLFALSIAGLIIVVIFSEVVKRDQREDLRGSLDLLTAAMTAGPAPEGDELLPDARYLQPGSGLYYQVVDLNSGDVLRSRSLWDDGLALSEPPSGEDALINLMGPNNQSLAVLVRDVRAMPLDAPARDLRLAVAEDVNLRGHSVRDFALQILIALGVLGATLFGGGWVLLSLSLRPVDELRNKIEALAKGGERLEANVPAEFQPLVSEVNGLVELYDRAVAKARERADDLAHGLKTPLAVIRATAHRLRDAGDTENAATLELLSDEMNDRIEYQLRLSHLRIPHPAHGQSSSVDKALIRSVAVVRKTGRGADLYWNLDADRVDAQIDSHDLMELVGVLLENAAKWARSKVHVWCARDGSAAKFSVADDGPGLTEAEIMQLGERGKRLDETRSGSGFGIAIAKEIVALNGGRLSIERVSPEGGLRISVELNVANVATSGAELPPS